MLEEKLESETKESKQKEQFQYLAIAFLVGVGYYFFFFLPEQRNEAKKEIKLVLEDNSPVTADELDNNLWKGFKSWQEKLDKLYLPNQISKFSESMIEAIETRKKEIEAGKAKNLKEARENAIKSIKDFAKKEVEQTPSFEREVKKFYKKINSASENDISSIIDEVNKIIAEQKNKRQRLHWLRESKNWADKKLEILKQDFDQAWNQLNGLVNPHNEPDKEPNKCNFAASYKINFPPSLWNDLTEEQKVHDRTEELKLRDQVDSYTFNPKIDNWYDKAFINPVRGERDKSNTDNNATLYGAPRTGKSIIVEKLAYKADCYPLVVIQGSALTPTINDQKCGVDNFKKFIYTICDINNTLVDDFDFQVNPESGEPRYIFFIDEANQVSENTFVRKSSGLTFLKECMGSDNYKKNESHNLWIFATNHLNQIEEAAYRAGRLSNALDFSWTWNEFKKHMQKSNILHQLPERWQKEDSLNPEADQWIKKFSIPIFHKDFLGNDPSEPNKPKFWNLFITNNPNAILKEEVEIQDDDGGKKTETEETEIELDEFLEFFWYLRKSGQLESYKGDFSSVKQPKTEDVLGTQLPEISNYIAQSSNALSICLDNITGQLKGIYQEISSSGQNSLIQSDIRELRQQLADLAREVQRRN